MSNTAAQPRVQRAQVGNPLGGFSGFRQATPSQLLGLPLAHDPLAMTNLPKIDWSFHQHVMSHVHCYLSSKVSADAGGIFQVSIY